MKNWEQVFYSNISTYIGLINKTLSIKFPLTKLGQYIKLKGGYAFKSSEYKTIGIPVIRISDFQNEQIVLDNVKYYKEDDSLKKYELYQGDIIIAMTGGTIGKLAIVQSGLGKLYLNQRVGKFEIINNDDFVQEYVYWIARGVESKVKELAWGGAQPNVSSKQIENMEFSLPNKEIQKRIIEFLNDLKNNSISNNTYFDEECEKSILNLQNSGSNLNTLNSEIKTQQTLLKKFRQSILQEAIEGKLTASWREQNPDIENASSLLEKIKAEKEQLVKDKKIKKQKPLPLISEDEIPFHIPDSWEWCKIGNISNVKVGSTPSRPVKEYWAGDIHWVSSGEVANNFIYDTKEMITEKGFESTSLIIYPKGSVLVAMIGQGKTRGQTSILKIDATINQNVAGMVFEYNNIISEYVWNFFLSRYELTRSGASGGNQPALNGMKIKNTLLPLPPLQEQKEIVKRIKKLFKICDELEIEINKSKTNSQTLMQAVLKEAFEQ